MLLINFETTKNKNINKGSILDLNERETTFINRLKKKGFTVTWDNELIYIKKTKVKYTTNRSDFRPHTKRLPQ